MCYNPAMLMAPPRVGRLAAACGRVFRSLHFFEVWLLGMVALMHILFLVNGWGWMAWTFKISIKLVMPLALTATPGGVAVVAAWEGLRSRSWAGVTGYLRGCLRRDWWGLTLRIWLAIVLTSHVYIWLKLNVPHLNGRLLDLWVWRMEEQLFFGYSPNRFILELFSQPPVLEAVDWSYVRVFLTGLYASFYLLPFLPSNRLRVACVTSYALLWTLGGWIHVLLPALGPCYWFPSVWAPYAEWLRNSAASQAALLDNYREMTVFRFSGELKINPMYGVAAIPSMHNASQALLAFWAMRLNRMVGLLAWVSVSLLFFGSVITGWHYLVDAVAGILLAWGVYAGVRRWCPVRPGPGPGGEAPPPPADWG